MNEELEFDFDFSRLAFRGDYEKWVNKNKQALKQGWGSAVKETSNRLKSELRRQVRRLRAGRPAGECVA